MSGINSLKNKTNRSSLNIQQIEVHQTEKEIIDYSFLVANTIIEIVGLQVYKMLEKEHLDIIDIVSDSIVLGLSNYTLFAISKTYSSHMGTKIRDVYYPLTSGLFFAGYNNVMYSNSYIKSLSLISPVIIGEYYFRVQSSL